jgi:AcrR family transcriptional regulator
VEASVSDVVIEPTGWQAKRGARTVRGEQRRTALLDAAEQVFRKHPYDDVRVADIVTAAGTSHGTFYKYYGSKEAAFEAVVERLRAEILGTEDREPVESSHLSLYERIESANRRYLDAFRRYANIMITVDYTRSPNLESLQHDFREQFVVRIERNVLRWQRDGLADPLLDAHYAAHALGGMVSRFAYVSMVLGEHFDHEQSIEQLTRLWANALQVTTPTEAGERPKS